MADKHIIQAQTLTDIADAIRLKRDIVEEIIPEDMPLQIGLIPTGGGSTVKDIILDADTIELVIATNATRLMVWRDDVLITPTPSQPGTRGGTVFCTAIKGLRINGQDYESSWIGGVTYINYTGAVQQRSEAIFEADAVTMKVTSSAYMFRAGLYHYIEF